MNEMETERWKKLEAIYHSALAIEPDEREEFLQNICADDPEMLREVKALLASDLSPQEILQDDVFDIGMKILAERAKNMNGTITDKFTTNNENKTPNLIGGRYELIRLLDKGGIGEVYLANDIKLKNKVVVKFLQSEANSNWIVEKFEKEPVVQSRVSHPNVAKALDKDILPNGKLYLVMEFIEGTNLTKLINDGKISDEQIPFETIAEIIKQTGRGVNAVHEANLIHRDLKPANLMIQRKDNEIIVKVIDFGIVRDLEKETALMSAGTLAYMPVEQIEGNEVTSATDVFALGVIAYQLLTFNLPFKGENAVQQVYLQQQGVKILPSVLRPDLPKEAETLILQALSYEAAKRPQSAKEFGDNLAEILTRKPEPKPKPNYFKPLTAVAAVLILVLAALAGWLWLKPKTKIVKADEIVKTRPQKPTGNNKPETVSQTSEQPDYDAEIEFPTDEVPDGMALAQIGLNIWRPRPATSQDDRNIVARETNDVKEEVVYESNDEFIKNGERFRLSIEAMTKGFLSEGSGYVYIVNREQYADGSFGKARLIFPKTSNYNGDNLLRAGQPIILPQAKSLLFKGLLFEVNRSTRSSSRHIAETYTIIISPWKFALPEPLGKEPMILPDNLFADWERQYAKMYRATLKNSGNKLMTLQEQIIMSRETNDVPETLTQSDTETSPQIVYRGAVKIGNPAMFTVALKFKD